MSRNVKVRTKSLKSLFVQILSISMYELVWVPYLHLYLRSTSQPHQHTASLNILTLTSHVKPQTQWKRKALHTSRRCIAAFDRRSVSGCGAAMLCCSFCSAVLCFCARSCCSFSLVFFEVKFLDCSNRKNITNFSQ